MRVLHRKILLKEKDSSTGRLKKPVGTIHRTC